MIKLKTLCLEMFVPDRAEFDRAIQAMEYPIIHVLVNKTGQVFIDDPNVRAAVEGENLRTQAALDFKQKLIAFYKGIHGNKVDANTQQLIAGLLKKGIIDNTWKVSFKDDTGYYLDGKYAYKRGEYENLPPNFWARNSRINLGENLQLYHGTSTKELPMIMKYGLRPLGMKHTSGGGESRLRVPENERNLYLSGNFEGAWGYAKLKARWNMREEDKQKYQWVEHWEWERWWIQPVVLLVNLPDFTRLRSDDDRVISLIKQKADELWKQLTPEQKEEQAKLSSKWFKDRNVNFEPREIYGHYWVMSDNGFQIVMPHIDKSEWKDWQASLKASNQVGYEGVIPPKYLKVIDLKNVEYSK